VGAALVLYSGRHVAAFLGLITCGIACTYGCSAGISRAVMLLVPRWMRAFALAFMTLSLHALGDVPSPPLIGLLASSWAPSCVGTPSAACLGADKTDWAQPYTHDQLGVLFVLLCASLYMVTCTLYWGAAYLILRVRTRRAARLAPPDGIAPLPSLGIGTDASGTEPDVATTTGQPR